MADVCVECGDDTITCGVCYGPADHCGDLGCMPTVCAEDELFWIRLDEERAYDKEEGHR